MGSLILSCLFNGIGPELKSLAHFVKDFAEVPMRWLCVLSEYFKKNYHYIVVLGLLNALIQAIKK